MTADRPTTAAGHGWRHAMWCRWERAESTCSCGLRAYQAEARQPDSAALDDRPHRFARFSDLAACVCGDWHPIAYLAALPPSEPAA